MLWVGDNDGVPEPIISVTETMMTRGRETVVYVYIELERTTTASVEVNLKTLPRCNAQVDDEDDVH